MSQLGRDKTKDEVRGSVIDQINLIESPALIEKIKNYLIEPALDSAIWDYDQAKQTYPVWLVLVSKANDTAILFSEYGFQFNNWGLIHLSDVPFHFGMDSNWFPTLESAFLDSFMAE